MPIVYQQSSGKYIDPANVGKQVRPKLIVRLTTAGVGMRRWGLAKFGTNQILGASLTSSGFYYSTRYMQVKKQA